MNKKKPIVSVIIPLFDGIIFFEETIKSVTLQTYPFIEIIIIDDFSTDGSFELAKKYQSERIIVKQNIRKGACAARNYGFELSSGDYIQYLDADDILSPDKIEKQLEKFILYGNEIVVNSSWVRFYENINTARFVKQVIDKDYENPINWLIDCWNEKGMGQTSIWLTPRVLIEKAGVWNEKLAINQDGEFFSRVLLNAAKIIYCEDAKVFYRSGNFNSISRKNTLGESKANSLLNSYRLYEMNLIKKIHNSTNLKKALGNNYLKFIYQFYPHYPHLLNEAEELFYGLGFNKMWPVGGRRFKDISKIIGFKNSLRLKIFFSKYVMGSN